MSDPIAITGRSESRKHNGTQSLQGSERSPGEIRAMVQQYLAKHFRAREKRIKVQEFIAPLATWGQVEVAKLLGRAEIVGKFHPALELVLARKPTWDSQPDDRRGNPDLGDNQGFVEQAYAELGIPKDL